VFTSRPGLPLHNGDFYTHVWRKLMKALAAEDIAPFRFHDLRHTHVAWLVAGGAPLPHIRARLGHESITTTIDTYGHLLPAGDETHLRDHRHRPDRRHDPTEGRCVNVLLSRFTCNTLEERR
jgi:integrase